MFINLSKFKIVKYFADYQKDRVYSLDPAGNGIGKEISIESTRPVRFTLKTWKITNANPYLLQEENGVGYMLEEIKKDEFDGFGIKWIWSPFGGANQPIITL